MRRPALAALALVLCGAMTTTATGAALAQPSGSPSATSSAGPTPSPTADPGPEPTASPTPEPEPSVAPPDASPTGQPTADPSPSSTPTEEPPEQPEPTPEPSDDATDDGAEEPPTQIVPRPIPAFPARPNRHGWMVGDSITMQSAPNFRLRFHKFDHTAISGIGVQELPRIVAARIAHAPLPSHVVVALGTNQADSWSEDPRGNYQTVIDMIHAASPRTKIVLITTYRDPRRAHMYTFGDDVTMSSYSRAMVELANAHPRVCVASWRWWIARNAHHLYDGVHPTYPGRRKWAELLESAIHTRC